MIVGYVALIVLFSSICCWMATSSSSAPPEAPELFPKVKRQIYVNLTSICTQGDRDGIMFRIHGLTLNKKNDSKKKSIATKFIYDSEEEALADVPLFRWYHGDKTNEPGVPAMLEPWDPDWICKPRETVSWTAIIPEVEGGQLSWIQTAWSKHLLWPWLVMGWKGAFFVSAYDNFSDPSDSGSDSDYMRAVMMGWKP